MDFIRTDYFNNIPFLTNEMISYNTSRNKEFVKEVKFPRFIEYLDLRRCYFVIFIIVISIIPEEQAFTNFLMKRDVIYVGKAKNLKSRVSSYFTHGDLGYKTALLVSQIKEIKTVVVNSEIESYFWRQPN